MSLDRICQVFSGFSMARFNFSIEMGGAETLRRGFNKVIEPIEDLRPAGREVQAEFQSIMRERFATQGNGWQELSSPYKEIKAIEYPGAKILHREGDLEESLTGETSDTVAEFRKESITLGTNLFTGRLHQDGTSRMPARKIFDFGQRENNRIFGRMRKSLMPKIKASGLEVSE